MKCNVEECKKILDDLVFNNPDIKRLVEEGYVLPVSELGFDYLIKGQVSIKYQFKWFGEDFLDSIRALNVDDDEYLFGFREPDALKKAADRIISYILYKGDPANKADYERRQNEMYSEFYSSGRYNGD